MAKIEEAKHVGRLKSGHMSGWEVTYLMRMIKYVHASIECSIISVGDRDNRFSSCSRLNQPKVVLAVAGNRWA